MARGPQSITQPVGSVTITAGSSIQAAVTANAAGTSFWLTSGIFSILGPITPKTGNTFTGQLGAIIDGTGWTTTDPNTGAFRSHNQDINNVTIRNLYIQNMPQKGVHAFKDFADGWVVDNCEISLCRVGVFFGNTMTASRCVIHHCLGNESSPDPNLRGGAIGSYQAISPTLDDCEIYSNGREQKLFGSTNVTMTNNYVHDCPNGLWGDACDGGTITGNTVTDCGATGIFWEASRNGVIHSNTVTRTTTSAIYVSISYNTQVYNNTISASFRAIEQFLDCARLAELAPYGAIDLRDNSIHNNTITIPTTAGAYGSTLFLSHATAAQLVLYTTGKNLFYTVNAYRAATLTTKYWVWGNVTKTWAEWQAIPQDAAGTLSPLAPPATLTGARLVMESVISLGGTAVGDVRFGRGMAFRMAGTQLKLMFGTYNPQNVLEFDVPASRTGVATYVRDLGTLPNVSFMSGLHWDDTAQRLYFTSFTNYGTAPNPVKTVARGYIDGTTGKLVSEGYWSFTSRSYKMAMGGVTAVPQWFQDAYAPGQRLAVGFGGYYSVLATGPVSMGPALTAFAPPVTNSTGTIANRPLQGYAFNTALSVPRQHRATNYKQYFENTDPTTGAPLNNPALMPVDPTIGGIGYWTWADAIFGAGAWVDTPNFSGFVTCAKIGINCCWYGNNFGYVNQCSGTIGSPAAITSSSTAHAWFITAPSDMALVAAGAAQTSIQSAFTDVQFPGIAITKPGSTSAYPMIGMPSDRMQPVGMTWIPAIQRLAVALYQANSASGPLIFFIKVSEGGEPPAPGVPPGNDNFSSAIALTGTAGSVSGTTVNSTIQAGEPFALGSVWYTYTSGAEPVDFTVSATGQTINVYTGTSVGGLTVVTSGTGVRVPALTALKIRVIPLNTTNGFTLTWDDVEPPPPPPPPPPTPDPLVIANSSLPPGEVSALYPGITILANGGVQPYTYSQTGAPSGVTMTTAGVLAGTPVASGLFSVDVAVTDTQPATTHKVLPLTITPAPVITTLALTSGEINVVYPGATLAVSGGTAPFAWSQTGGPIGLTLSAAGVYTGTPLQSGSFTVAAVVTDTWGVVATRNLPLTIAAAPDELVITTSSLPNGQIGVVYTGAQMAATGGVPPRTWAQTGGPTGLSMSAGGAYTGTPSQSGSFTVDVAVTDSQPVVTHRNLSLLIAAVTPPDPPPPIPPLVITTASLPQATVGTPYSLQFTATGGTSPRSWNVQSLPVEFSMTASGLLSGTPTVAIVQLIQVAVTDSSNPPQTVGQEYQLTVVGPAPDPGGQVPGTPLIYKPKNKAKNVTETTTQGPYVRWFSVQTASSYQVYHGITPNPPLIGTVLAGDGTYEATYPLGSLQFPVTRATRTTYYWRVIAINGAGVTPSPLWKYTTK